MRFAKHESKPRGRGESFGRVPPATHEEPHEGVPVWLISFADNATLMMGFFVILLAMNLKPAVGGLGGDSKEPGHPQPAPEMLDLAIAIRDAFNNPIDPNNASTIELPLVQRMLERSGTSSAEQAGQMGREHDVRSIRRSLYFSPAGSIPFDADSSAIGPAGRESLRQMHKVVKGHNLVIELRGHASAAEAFERHDRGVRLSYDRAAAVAQSLVAEGIPWSQLRIIACGDSERLYANAYNELSHRANRRVEIIVTDQVLNDPTRETD